MATVKPVDQWDIGDATNAIKADLVTDYEINRKMVEEGDHFQGGLLWPGHRTGDRITDAALLKNVEPQFVADDVTGEMIENRTNGLLKQEADVSLIALEEPTSQDAEDNQDERELEILSQLATWWDRKQFWTKVGEAVDRVSWAKRGNLRVLVAEGNLNNGALPSRLSFEEALDLIEIEAPPPASALVYTDPNTQRKHGVVISKVDDVEQAEIWSVNPATKKTEVRIARSDNTSSPRTLPGLDLGGRLPVGEVRGQRILTHSVRRLQSLLNFITTVTGRTVETAGFRERYLGNVEPPGMWLPTPPTNSPPLEVDDTSVPGKTFYKHRVSWVLGASINQEIQGLRVPTFNAQGDRTGDTFATPSVTALDPVNPEFATKASDAVSSKIYRRGRQGHLALDSTQQASGIAYQQARAQFEADLIKLKGGVEGMIRDILEAVLALAGLMSSEAANVLKEFRIQVILHVSAGPVTADEARLATELRDKRAISQQTMMARVGVEDPAAEEAAIVEDPFFQMDLLLKRLEVYQKGIDAGMEVAAAAHFAGFSPEDSQIIETGKVPTTEDATPPRLSAA